jgi:hypothetical protein
MTEPTLDELAKDKKLQELKMKYDRLYIGIKKVFVEEDLSVHQARAFMATFSEELGVASMNKTKIKDLDD